MLREVRATMWAMLGSACAALVLIFVPVRFAQSDIPASNDIVLHTARLLDVERGTLAAGQHRRRDLDRRDHRQALEPGRRLSDHRRRDVCVE